MATRRLVLMACLVAVASVLHWVEGLLPLPFPIPGAKLGLANAVTLVALALFGLKDCLWIVFLRVVVGALLGGTIMGPAFAMSVAGAIFSMSIMYIVLKYWTSFSFVGISVWGAVAHNTAQLAVAAVLVQSFGVWQYLPYLLLLALPAGIITGLLVRNILSRVRLINTWFVADDKTS